MKLKVLICALLAVSAVCNAQLRTTPQYFDTWLQLPGLKHATATLAIKDLTSGETLYEYDAERAVQPASVIKLVTTATALLKLGGDRPMPDNLCCIDTTILPMPELAGYNPDWLIEDVGSSYMLPLTTIPDVGLPLRDFIAKTNQESLNENAEALVYLLGASNMLSAGLDTIRTYWNKAGLDTEALIMYDGCGLAPADRVTASFIVDLLDRMWGNQDFLNSLAIAGQTGTVKRFLKGSRLDGKAWLKTGTTKSVVAYAGYMQGSNGHTYAMAFFVNSHSCVIPVLRKNIENLLLLLIP